MSLRANIEHLSAAHGIDAVTVDTGDREFRGAERFQPILAAALDLFAITEETSIRLVVGDHTLVVQREREETVAVALPTGHAIAKSLRRMIRRMAKKPRGPLPVAASRPADAPVSPANPAKPVQQNPLGNSDYRSPF